FEAHTLLTAGSSVRGGKRRQRPVSGAPATRFLTARMNEAVPHPSALVAPAGPGGIRLELGGRLEHQALHQCGERRGGHQAGGAMSNRPVNLRAQDPCKRQTPRSRGAALSCFEEGPGWIRTTDQRIMSSLL